MRLDALIFGGGAAGLWLLDRLSRLGHHVLLLEAGSLGGGQTVLSQGVIPCGIGHNLDGSPAKISKSQREVARIWHNALLGVSTPNLSNTRLRSGCCYLWHKESTSSFDSQSQQNLRVYSDPEKAVTEDPPEALSGCGSVLRLPEQVIAPRSLVQDLARQYQDRILKIDAKRGLQFVLESPGEVSQVLLTSPRDETTMELCPRQVIFTAGGGNARLRQLAGLSTNVIERRRSYIALVRGELPELNGHCVDGLNTRFTITSETDSDGRMVWQVGGRIANEGIKLDADSLIEHVRSELSAALPGVNLTNTEWSTYRVDRSDESASSDSRMETIQVLCAGNVTTGWRTSLAMAPVLAQEIASRASSPYMASDFDSSPFAKWPRPEIAPLPWMEADREWQTRKKAHARKRHAA